MLKAKRKERKCKCCKEVLPPTCIYLCEKCEEAGMGRRKKSWHIEPQELLQIAQQRQYLGVDPIEGMDMAQVNTLARLFKPPYSTYGRFRGYVRMTGKLPPSEYLR